VFCERERDYERAFYESRILLKVIVVVNEKEKEKRDLILETLSNLSKISPARDSLYLHLHLVRQARTRARVPVRFRVYL